MMKSHSAHDMAGRRWPVGHTINVLTCWFIDPAGYRGTINILICSFVDPAGYRGTINVLTCSFVNPAGYRGTINILTCLFIDPAGYCCNGQEREYSTCREKRKLSLSLPKKKCFQETTEQDLVNLLKPEVPKNINVSTCWAMKNFREWYDDFCLSLFSHV